MSNIHTTVRRLISAELCNEDGISLDELFRGMAETVVGLYCSAAKTPKREEFIAFMTKIYDEALDAAERRAQQSGAVQ